MKRYIVEYIETSRRTMVVEARSKADLKRRWADMDDDIVDEMDDSIEVDGGVDWESLVIEGEET